MPIAGNYLFRSSISYPDINNMFPEFGFRSAEFAMFIQNWAFP